ncbi:MAG: class I SAM-dependent methyltransferase [Gammaproteobacteria bacterium]|nr:class I SAM-dependent methyltransferase [Gammaproteobacteria bacterium]MDH3464451.1 class I SAM-dependent methyltransferase [Gammaproteobacteria bacterium]
MSSSSVFGEDYYARYYHVPESRIESVEETEARIDFVCKYITYLDQRIKTVLDLGCGVGHWQSAIGRSFPGAQYTGVEYSEYLCDRYGWELGSVATFDAKHRFDFVICYDVLQYLDDRQAERAIENLCRLCRGVLYFGVLTKQDWQENCDQQRTDGDVYLRKGKWYRRRLRPEFQNLGGGLFLHEKSPVVVYDMESMR